MIHVVLQAARYVLFSVTRYLVVYRYPPWYLLKQCVMIIDNKTTSFVSKASCNRISCYFFFPVNAIKIVQKNVLILTLCKSNPRKKITQKYKSKGRLEKISIWHQVDQRYLYIHRSWDLIQIQGNFSCNSQIIQENILFFLKCILENVMVIYCVQMNTLPFHCLI